MNEISSPVMTLYFLTKLAEYISNSVLKLVPFSSQILVAMIPFNEEGASLLKLPVLRTNEAVCAGGSVFVGLLLDVWITSTSGL